MRTAHRLKAKGRVERLFQTLQDRMCKAMRLAHICDIEQANAWLEAYIVEHNHRFAVLPQRAEDAHRRYRGSGAQLSRICALHHRRQLSKLRSCQFEGSQLWMEQGQVGAPPGRAQVDIAQYGDGRLEVLYRGQVLQHRAYLLHEHLQGKTAQDAKTVNQRVDTVVKEQRRLARLRAEIALQEDMREVEIYQPSTHPSAPPALSCYGLRPA